MPRFLKIIIICVLFSITAVPAFSELYQYRDENGIMRLTDNKYSVPVDSRSKLEQFSEFEGISDELVIIPIQEKSLAPTQNQSTSQVKTEKVILPKTSKEIPVKAEAQEDITRPEAGGKTVSASNQTTTDPFKPLTTKKTIQEPDTSASVSIPHKSKKITIKRTDKIDRTDKTDKKITSRKTTPVTPEKSIPEKPVSFSERETAVTKKTPSKEHADVHKSPAKTKTKQVTPEKDLKKSDPSDTQNPAISKKKIAKHTEKTDKINSTPKKGSKAVAKKEIKSTLPEKMAKKAIEPERKSTAAPEIKPDIKEKVFTETKKSEQTEIEIVEKKSASDVKKVKQEVKVPEKTAIIKSTQKSITTSAVKKEKKLKKIIAEKKSIPSSKAQTELPKKNVKKETQTNLKKKKIPEVKPETTPETNPKIVKKDPANNITPQKYAIKSDSETKKTPQPKIAIADQNPAPAVKTAKKEASVPRKTTEIKSAQKAGIATVVKKETKVKNIVTDEKAADSQKVNTELAKQMTKKATQPNIQTKAVPEIKKPGIEKVDTDGPADAPLAKKGSDSVIMAGKTDSNKLAVTKKTKPDIHLVPSKQQRLNQYNEQTSPSEKKVTQSPGIEADSNKVNQKDESIILAKLESTRRVLANKKKALNEKFSNLMKEKQEIENNVDEDDEKSVLTYNESVKKLNIKIKQYKKEKKALQAAIEKYNNSINQSALN